MFFAHGLIFERTVLENLLIVYWGKKVPYFFSVVDCKIINNNKTEPEYDYVIAN